MTMKSMTAPAPTSGLGHSLKPRQLTMMGLGSAIGAGLFLGSGAGVQAAGPAVLISYLVAGTLIILVMWALGEMAAANPNSGAFSVYAEKALGKTAGGTIGWLWWLQLVVVIAAEALGAAGLLFSVWPVVPVWALALIFMVVFTGINLVGVRNFGEFEFWFAILKVAAIVIFLLIGAALLLGLLPSAPSPGLSAFGDFAPNGIGGIAAALFVVIFAFGGTEIVSVAAAETEDPAHSVGKAIRTVVWRILVFYIGSVFVIAAILPVGSEGLKSPFAGVLDLAGIPGAGAAITLVAVVALLSALNANLYGASRMVFSLSRRGEAPRFLSRLSPAKVPVAAVGVSVAFGFIATVLELLFPDLVLPALLNLVGSTCLVVWGIALVSQLILRRRADREGTELPLRMKGFPVLTIVGLVLLGIIFAVGFANPESAGQLFGTAALILVIALGCYLNARSKAGKARAEETDGAV
ncbi:amino acid permease [Arthrobacter sp. TES]|uniref:Amino acid permease n=1 Tax=Paenarthrobacter ureafaciens TaxID=37931 RepID=A0AAX3EDY6_PAEUR|nr:MULTISPECIES: amino acid permease [Paenarthrobacter]AOY70703.1 amino acid transporter [Arthrobacter sp. ZXY-2]ERI39239.1 amino acid transporter [Arthrobacter sp. AK-YN10]NKR13163.1 amino acid transporter [Arthrobacter sp. M5]NKR14987.1 amino acid transporter [Arthrobacter sp. M6]OEH62530.1 amino acid transporter [Arthrobacter sp. D4]OEH63101.1 amino acid transporter [Arthrobacter sp. D2]QOI62880.1 amino acid permease [Arthrobacter sp. TES]BCW84773.1 amino acid transporter [Arthrobacter s